MKITAYMPGEEGVAGPFMQDREVPVRMGIEANGDSPWRG